MSLILYRKDTGEELLKASNEDELIEKLWEGQWYRGNAEIPPLGLKEVEAEELANKTAELMKKSGFDKTLKELEKDD